MEFSLSLGLITIILGIGIRLIFMRAVISVVNDVFDFRYYWAAL